ncbi:MAG: hypothetical protein ABSF44_00215 [Candidatus Bathyarchaeia archaeon]
MAKAFDIAFSVFSFFKFFPPTPGFIMAERMEAHSPAMFSDVTEGAFLNFGFRGLEWFND